MSEFDALNNKNDAVESVARLAKLDKIEYESVREEEAKRLKFRVSVLDRFVAEARDDSEKGLQGSSIKLYEPELWEKPVNGADVLTEASRLILKHMCMSKADADACVLWAAHTHMFESFSHTPRLLITAPEPECGKTLLMVHMVGNLATKIQPVELMKTAPFFRMASSLKPTFLIDEADVFIKEDVDLLAAINSGWEPHGGVIRCTGDDNEPRVYSSHCPTAIAGVKLQDKMPGTTISRSVVINLDMAEPDAIEDANIWDKKKHKKPLLEAGRKIARFIHDNRGAIQNHRPKLPNGVRNRLTDKWTPLFSIAEIAGGDWPERAKKALLEQADLSSPSKARQLLADIKSILPPTGNIHTADLIDKICSVEGSIWNEYNFNAWPDEKKKIKDTQIAKILKPYKIESKNVKVNGVARKGYSRADLDKVFKKYTHSKGVTPKTGVAGLPATAGAGYRGNPNRAKVTPEKNTKATAGTGLRGGVTPLPLFQGLPPRWV